MLQPRRDVPVSGHGPVAIMSHKALPTLKEVGIILASESKEEWDLGKLSPATPITPADRAEAMRVGLVPTF